MAQNVTKPVVKSLGDGDANEKAISHSDIAALAYQLWQDRGCPIGSPEEDWYNAREQLNAPEKFRPAVA